MATKATLTVESVCEWTMIKSPEHRTEIPHMPKAERCAWTRLEDEIAMGRLGKADWLLLKALRRKMQYRADRAYR